ncbi:FecR family protein [Litoricolaceae bacterium]|nr:FecR family protein [Litorivicinaceae bacterium]
MRRLLVSILLVLIAPAVWASSQSGVVAAMKGKITIIRDDVEINAQSAQPIFLNDTIVTDKGARLQILLRDQSTFSVGENARITIDEFVYQPKDKTGSVAASIGKGAFRFVSGKIAKKNPNNMKVRAGDVVVAVRGTEVIGNVQPDQSNIILLSGAIDVMSLSNDCVSGGVGNAGFEIGPDGDLRMSGAPLANAPDSCARSVNLPGFAVSVSATGEVSEPLRVDLDEVDDVLDLLTVDEEAEETETETETETEAGGTNAETTDEAESEAELELDADGNPKESGETTDEAESEAEPELDADGNPKESGETLNDAEETRSGTTADSSNADLDADGNPKPATLTNTEVNGETAGASRSTVDLDANGQPKTDSSLGLRSETLGADGKSIATEQKAEASFDDLLKQDLFGGGEVDSTTRETTTMLGQDLKVEETAARIGEDGKPLPTADDGKEEVKVSAEEVASEKAEDEVTASNSTPTPAAPTIAIDQAASLASISRVAPAATSGNVGTATIAVSDPNGDAVTLTAKDYQGLTWIGLSDLGSGQYSMTISGSGAPSTAGSYTTTITASDGSLTASDTIILDVCSFDDCGDYVQSLDGVEPTATLDGSTGFKVSGDTYTFISNSGALYNSLFGSGKPTGTFEKTWKPTIDSRYGGGNASDSITGRIVVDFANESASIVIAGDLNNLSVGNYAKGDLTFSDTTSIPNIKTAPQAQSGLLLLQESKSLNSDEGGPFTYDYRIGIGSDGSGNLGVSGEVTIKDGGGIDFNSDGVQILEPQ